MLVDGIDSGLFGLSATNPNTLKLRNIKLQHKLKMRTRNWDWASASAASNSKSNKLTERGIVHDTGW
jgi:hypothetical protein